MSMNTNHEHLREVAEKATPGPWSINRHGAIVGGEFIEYTNGHGQSQLAMACGAHNVGDDERNANADFIATFNPATAIALLDELAALRKENEWLMVDAERYRHLRNAKDTKRFWIAHGEYGRMSRWNGERADELIDEDREAIGDSHE